MYEKIASAIVQAAKERNKTAMFHYQVFIHAAQLDGVNAIDFCRAVGMPDSFSVEFHKMLRLAKMVEQQGKKVI